jgi:hypothetical protein
MKRIVLALLLLFPALLVAQKSYLVHLTVDKIMLGKDSVVFKGGKTFLVETKDRTDTIEVTKLGGIPVAIVVDIRRTMVNKQIKYQLGYAWFQKIGNKWELIRHFGYTERYELLSPKAGFEASAKKKHANEEYHCEIGLPKWFSADFRMDVYKK